MAGGGGQTQDPFAQLAAPTPEEQALAAMSPTEALKFSKQLQNARVYSPEEAKANLKQTGYDIASITPVLGNLIAAKDTYDYGGQTLDTAKTGDIREQRKAALMMELSALGAVTGLPFGKIAQQTAQEARSTANIFAGPMARTADKAALEQAQRLEAHGASPDDIWRDTGWGRIDGNWKFEIPDKEAKLAGQNYIGGGITTFSGLDHPQFTSAYPDSPSFYGHLEPGKGLQGYYRTKGTPQIEVYSPNTEGARSVTLHELQHHVQNIEGWQGGNAPANAYDYRPVTQLDAMRQDYANKSEALYAEADNAYAAGDRERGHQLQTQAGKLSNIFMQISKRGYGPYWRTAGEVEARNVQTRRDFTSEQSRAIPPWQTQDMPPELYTQLKENQPQGPSAMMSLTSAPAVPKTQTEMKVYHGTHNGPFERFDLSKRGKTGSNSQGVYLTDDIGLANEHADYMHTHMGGSPHVIPAYVETKGFKQVDLKNSPRSIDDEARIAKQEGYPGIVAKNTLDMFDRSFKTQIVTWKPGTLRSAISENTLFSGAPMPSTPRGIFGEDRRK